MITVTTPNGTVQADSLGLLMNARSRIGPMRARKPPFPAGFPYDGSHATLDLGKLVFSSPGATYDEAMGAMSRLIEDVFQ
jgi:hypothetical protein